MKRPMDRVFVAVVAGTVCIGGLLAAGSASALTDAEIKCQKDAGKASYKLFKNVMKAVKSCQDKISKGVLPPATDCATEPTAATKIAKAETAFSNKLTASCPDAAVSGLNTGGALAGDCAAATTSAALATCLKESHESAALDVLGIPYAASSLLSADQGKCQKKFGAAAIKISTKRLSTVQKCKGLIAVGSLAPGTNCLTTAKGLKLADLVAKTVAKMGKSCPQAVIKTITLGSPCGGVGDGASAAACAFCDYASLVDALVLTGYGSTPSGGGGPVTNASAVQITTPASECVGGPLSRCRLNDYLLSNDRIRVVIQDLQRNLFSIGQFGGQIIDADLVRTPPDADRDNFEEWSISLNIENTAHYTSLTILNDGTDGKPAVIRATGVDDLLDFLNPSSTVAGLGFTLPASTNDTDIPTTIVTDYILEPEKNYVRVETTVTNTSGAELKTYFGEFINGSGELEFFQPTYGFGEPLATAPCPIAAANKCDFVAFAGRDDAEGVSYGYVNTVPGSSTFSTAGVTVPQLGVAVLNALAGFAGPPFAIPAGGSTTFTRYFVVGNGTVSSISDARNALQCVATGTLEGTVTAGGVPMAGIDVTVLGTSPAGTGPVKDVVTHTKTDAAGKYSLTLPPAAYKVVANLDGYPFEGGGGTPLEHAVTIALDATTTQDMALPATGGLHVTLVDEGGDPIPGKVSVVGFDPSPDPLNTANLLGLLPITMGVFGERFGGSLSAGDGLPFGVSKVLFLDETGDSGVVPLEPGSYRVVVSHGPEYSVATSDITVTAGATSTVNAQIADVVNSAGLVGSDFHVHSIDSPDSKISRAKRVQTMRAEGVNFFTPSDHDFRGDFAPTIAALGISSDICTATSGEITTFDYGHFNAWPMSIDTSKVNGGSVDHGGAAAAGTDYPSLGNYSRTPAQIIADAHAGSVDGQSTVQINHFYSHFGLQSGSGLAIDTGLTPPQSASSAIMGPAKRLNPAVSNYFDDGFDALEIWIGEDRSQVFNNMYNEQDPDPAKVVSKLRGGTLGDWFNLINQGIVRTGVADSDTHRRILTQAGTPRTMVAADTDEPCGLADPVARNDAMSDSVNAGRAVGTNGPLVRVTTHATSTLESGALERRCVDASPCTDVASCEPCSDTEVCGSGVCTLLPREIATGDGAVDITVDVQSPVWAEFDRIEFYVNPITKKSTVTGEKTGAGSINVNHYGVVPSYVKNAGVDFTVSTVTDYMAIAGAQHLEASYTLSLTGLTSDVWVAVIVRGTDGVSKPLFPMVPNDLKQSTNTTLANLIDGNLGENGLLSLAFTNPLFVDVDGGGWTAPGVSYCKTTGLTCSAGAECCSATCSSGLCS